MKIFKLLILFCRYHFVRQAMWASQLSKIALSWGFSKCSLSFSLSVGISFEETFHLTVNGKPLTTKVSNCCQNVEFRPIPFSNIKDLSFLRLFRWSITLGALWVLVVGASGESVWATGTAGLLSNTSLAHLPTTLALLFLLIFNETTFFLHKAQPDSKTCWNYLSFFIFLFIFIHFVFSSWMFWLRVPIGGKTFL